MRVRSSSSLVRVVENRDVADRDTRAETATVVVDLLEEDIFARDIS